VKKLNEVGNFDRLSELTKKYGQPMEIDETNSLSLQICFEDNDPIPQSLIPAIDEFTGCATRRQKLIKTRVSRTLGMRKSRAEKRAALMVEWRQKIIFVLSAKTPAAAKGNLQGILRKSGCLAKNCPQERSKSWTIHYKMKQGINSRRTGNLSSRAGNLSSRAGNLQRLAGNCPPCAGAVEHQQGRMLGVVGPRDRRF
jgi:hypothetical protein